MPETELELQTKKDEKRERKRREQQTLTILAAIAFGFLVGYVIGHQQGVFEGYQLCLKQFDIIRHVPELFL